MPCILFAPQASLSILVAPRSEVQQHSCSTLQPFDASTRYPVHKLYIIKPSLWLRVLPSFAQFFSQTEEGWLAYHVPHEVGVEALVVAELLDYLYMASHACLIESSDLL